MASTEDSPKQVFPSFNFLRGISWANGRKKVKQAHLGQENNMYFHPELKRWVETGKEEEAERQADRPPPPPVLSACSLASAPLPKRPLSQRYVLQPNLSVSSSMASLACSMSQPDLLGLAAGHNDSFSGPPSAIPSPPQSRSSLVPPAPFACGPPSTAFFIPYPRQQTSQHVPGTFFVPALRVTGDSTEDGGLTWSESPSRASSVDATYSAEVPAAASAGAGAGAGAAKKGDPHLADSRSSPNQIADAKAADQSTPQEPSLESRHTVTFSHRLEMNLGNNYAFGGWITEQIGPALAGAASSIVSNGAADGELSLCNGLVSTSFRHDGGCQFHCSSTLSASDFSMLSGDYSVLSFPSAVERPVESLVELIAPAWSELIEAEKSTKQFPVNMIHDVSAAVDSNSLFCSMSFSDVLRHQQVVSPVRTPVPTRGLSYAGEGEAVSASHGNGLAVEEEACEEDHAQEHSPSSAADGGLLESTSGGEGLVVVGGGDAEGDTGVAGEEDTAVGATTAAGDAAVVAGMDSSTLYSQYYYQQYAYLYQYALEQGSSEVDAVSYAQYYAAAYAQQYESQAPEGHIGGNAATHAAAVESEEAVGEMQEQQQQQPLVVSGGEEAPAVDSLSAAAVVPASEAVGRSAHVVWEAAAAAVEDEAPVVELAVGEVNTGAAEVGDVYHRQDPVYLHTASGPFTALRGVAPAASHTPAPELEAEAEEVTSRPILAAPLPADLTAAATAATQHHQSAVTAAVAAAAAAFDLAQLQQLLQPQTSRPISGAGATLLLPAASKAFAYQPASTASAALAPQLLLGLGAAGAKRLTQFSTAASTAVASLGSTVAAAVPVAAALSAATAAASTAASAASGFVGLDSVRGLSEDDFERIMHPGDPAKLDGPLPWELPEHLRTSRKFLALCANWQLGNPGQPYVPHLLLQQGHRKRQKQCEPELHPQQGLQVVMASGSDVALAAEGGSGPTGRAGQLHEHAEEENVSSYERACRLAPFGHPVTGLVPTREAKHKPVHTTNGQKLRKPLRAEQQQLVDVDEHVAAHPNKTSNENACVVATASSSERPLLDSFGVTPVEPELAASAEASVAAAPLDLNLLPNEESPRDRATPRSARSDDPFTGVAPMPISQQLYHQHAALQDSPVWEPHCGVTLEQVLELEGEEMNASVAACAFERLGTAEAASFFDHLAEHTPSPAAAKPQAVNEDEAASVFVPQRAVEVDEVSLGVAEEEDNASATAAADPAAAAAAAAIDSVVQALEQLRNSAATGSGAGAVDSATGTALLLQIQSSLAQATQALADMGVDVSALTCLAAPLGSPINSLEWTPSAGHKRARVDTSPATPTRVAACGADSEGVPTPVLPPGRLLMRPVPEEVEGGALVSAGIVGPGERFHQLGKQLSDASEKALVQSSEAEACQTLALLMQQEQKSVVLSIMVTPAPEVDVAAVEERVRCEERAVWEAQLEAVVDSEREAAALVIAAVEQDRDGLQQRTRELEEALAAVTAERDGMAVRLSEVTAERDTLATALVTERLAKTTLEEVVAEVRAENEDVRRRYLERFSALSSELEATRGSLVELQGEHDELLLCLGQESTKVSVLTDALRDAGEDPEPLIERIEAEYETMGLGGMDESDGLEGDSEPRVENLEQVQAAFEGGELKVSQL